MGSPRGLMCWAAAWRLSLSHDDLLMAAAVNGTNNVCDTYGNDTRSVFWYDKIKKNNNSNSTAAPSHSDACRRKMRQTNSVDGNRMVS